MFYASGGAARKSSLIAAHKKAKRKSIAMKWNDIVGKVNFSSSEMNLSTTAPRRLIKFHFGDGRREPKFLLKLLRASSKFDP